MFVSWVVFPLVLAVLALGCGLLLEQLTGWLLPGPLVVPAGLAMMIVVASFTTATDATAELTVPVVAFLAVAGVALSFPWREGRVDPWASSPRSACSRSSPLPIAASGRRHLRRLHQARRHRHLVRAHRPRDGARPQPRRPRAVLVRGDARVQPRRRLSDRRLPSARGRRASWSARTSPGCSSPTSPSWPRCWRSPSTCSPAARSVAPAARAGRLRRQPAGAAVRLRAVGWSQGGRRGGADRAARGAVPPTLAARQGRLPRPRAARGGGARPCSRC